MAASTEHTLNGNKKTTNRKSLEVSDGKKTKPYRLTIQIDKIYLRPCPKSKKINQININSGTIQKKIELIQEHLKCLVCKKQFSTTPELYNHLKEHFICDICDTEFSSQKSIKKHSKIHLSEISQKPYRCHICEKLFDTKEDIRKHPHIKLDKYENDDIRIPYCNTCNISFRNELVYRKHLASHIEKPSELQGNDKNLTSGPQIQSYGQLRPVLFNCRICNKNFNNLADIDNHTKTHMQNLECMN